MEAACREDRGDAILSEIGARSDFPATMQAIERLRRVIERDDCTSLALAHVILQDAGLSSKVLRVVNSAFYHTGGVPVSTITRAILLLGFDRISDLATGLLVLEQFARKGSRNEILRAHLRRSLRCGIVAQALSRRGGSAVPEEAYLLGMFSNLGVLWLAAYYPDDLDAAAALVSSGAAASIEEAVNDALGVSPAAIAARVAEQWNLPATYSSYFQSQSAPACDDALTVTEEVSVVVALADAYARTAEQQAAPSPALLGRLAEYLSLSPEQAIALLQRSEAELKDHVKALRLDVSTAPAALSPARRSAGRPEPSGREPGHADATTLGGAAGLDESRGKASTGATAAPRSDRTLALAIIAEITDSIRVRHDIGSVLGAVLEGIARSGGFDAVVLSLLSRERDRLIARLGYGEGVQQELESLSVPLERGAGLLAEVVQSRKPRLVRMGQPRILVPPGAPTPRLLAASFAIEPLILRDRAVGTILASRGGPPAVSESEAGLVRLFANLACIALAEIGSRAPTE